MKKIKILILLLVISNVLFSQIGMTKKSIKEGSDNSPLSNPIPFKTGVDAYNILSYYYKDLVVDCKVVYWFDANDICIEVQELYNKKYLTYIETPFKYLIKIKENLWMESRDSTYYAIIPLEKEFIFDRYYKK